ncbi:Clp1/GlmU family protein [Methylorubrum extorquens]
MTASTGRKISIGWEDASDLVTAGTAKRIFVVGAQDSGKSTLCRILLSAAVSAGRSAAILDLDVGQKMIGPPACVTLGVMSGARAVLADLAFARTTNPMRAWNSILSGAKRLSQTAAADVLIVNTCGFVKGGGLALKIAQLLAVAPDALVVLGCTPDLDRILDDQQVGGVTLCLPMPLLARRKTEGERRAARRMAFRTYFSGGTMITLPSQQLTAPHDGADLPAGLLVGLEDQQGREVGIGVVVDPPRAEGALTLLVPAASEQFYAMKPGLLSLDQAFRERHVPHPST